MNTQVTEFIRPTATTEFQDPFSQEVWFNTYKDHQDLDINDTFWRVATAIASVEKTPELQRIWSNNFYDMMVGFKVIPGGRILANAGTEFKGTSLINCFVNPEVKQDVDSINGILKVLRDQTLTLKSEGGWGHNFSALRPRGAFIYGIGVETPGAVKFMELFDKSSEIITSGSGQKSTNKKAKGKIRKGAMMSVLDCFHPDIIEFITAKQTSNKLSKFNMSVNCSDAFMKKVVEVSFMKKAGASQEEIEKITWDLIFPDTAFTAYKTEWSGDIQDWLSKNYPVNVYKTVKVDWLWNLITQSTYNRNEPGILFLDRANKFNQLNYFEKIFATNPCSEQQLAKAGVCCLGTLNLTQFLNDEGTGVNFTKLRKYTKYLIRFLDNVNEYSDAPLPEYVDSMRKKRRIGAGLMGWGSLLFMLQIRFGSPEALALRDEILLNFTHAGVEASIDLAEEKGMFAYCQPEKHVESPYWDNINLSKKLRERMKLLGIRNSSLFSMQPNGNSSVLANIVSGGIEPIFLPEYIRTVIVTVTPDHIRDVTPSWEKGEWIETKMFKFTKEGDEQILRGKDKDGTIFKIDKNRGLTKEVLCQDYGVRYLSNKKQWNKKAKWAVTTKQLSVDEHVSDMTGFAKWTDSSISKTVNLPNDYPFDAFQDIYLNAYQSGYIKGLTTYRTGSMTSVLSPVEQKSEEEEVILTDVKLPDNSRAEVKVLRDHENGGTRKWYLTIILNENSAPVAIFVQTNAIEKSVTANDAVDKLMNLARSKGIPIQYIDSTIHKCHNDSNSVKIARAISLLLRHGVRIKNIVAEIDKVEGVTFASFLFHLKKVLGSYIRDNEIVDGAKCSICNGQLVYESGCKKCINCGNSACS